MNRQKGDVMPGLTRYPVCSFTWRIPVGRNLIAPNEYKNGMPHKPIYVSCFNQDNRTPLFPTHAAQ